MKFYYLFGVFLTFLASCVGNEIKSNLNEEKSIEFPKEISGQLSKFVLKSKDFTIDSIYFANDSTFKFSRGNLDIVAVKLLSKKLSIDEITTREKYYLNDFFHIQEAKDKGKFAQFKKKLDIGMTENAVCNAVGRIEYGDSTALLLWEIVYKSFDACPFYFGHDVMGSLVKNGKVISCITLAAKESGADAPMSYEMYQLVKMDEFGQIFIKNHSQTSEENTVIEKSKFASRYKINSFGFEWQK
jgi:hypothetical protein